MKPQLKILTVLALIALFSTASFAQYDVVIIGVDPVVPTYPSYSVAYGFGPTTITTTGGFVASFRQHIVLNSDSGPRDCVGRLRTGGEAVGQSMMSARGVGDHWGANFGKNFLTGVTYQIYISGGNGVNTHGYYQLLQTGDAVNY